MTPECAATLAALVEAAREAVGALTALALEPAPLASDPGAEEILLDTTAFMKLAGRRREWGMTLSLSRSLARTMVAAMLDLGFEDVDSELELHDGIGELANVVAGGGKARLSGHEAMFDLSTPIAFSRARRPAVLADLVLAGVVRLRIAGEPMHIALWSKQ